MDSAVVKATQTRLGQARKELYTRALEVIQAAKDLNRTQSILRNREIALDRLETEVAELETFVKAHT